MIGQEPLMFSVFKEIIINVQRKVKMGAVIILSGDEVTKEVSLLGDEHPRLDYMLERHLSCFPVLFAKEDGTYLHLVIPTDKSHEYHKNIYPHYDIIHESVTVDKLLTEVVLFAKRRCQHRYRTPIDEILLCSAQHATTIDALHCKEIGTAFAGGWKHLERTVTPSILCSINWELRKGEKYYRPKRLECHHQKILDYFCDSAPHTALHPCNIFVKSITCIANKAFLQLRFDPLVNYYEYAKAFNLHKGKPQNLF